jgi:hypothetical protein
VNRFIALAASLLLAAPAAHAESLTPGERRLARGIHAAGYRIIPDHHSCKDPTLLGAFLPNQRIVTLCSRNNDDLDSLKEVFRHEAVHVAQHCLGVDHINSKTDLARWARSSSFDFPSILSAYRSDETYSEIEAYLMGRYFTADQIAEILEAACL